MSKLDNLQLQEIKELERKRKSKVLVLAASALDTELLPHIYEILRGIGKVKRLDVVLYGRGGEINAARRVALLLHEFTNYLSFLVPFHCQSSFTVLSLSGHEIIAGDIATFSPIDPRLNGIDENGEYNAEVIDSENVRLFGKMSKNWFDLDIKKEEIKLQLLSSVASSIYPTTLTSLYRTSLEMKSIAMELLEFQFPDQSEQRKSEIVDKLLFGYYSHSYAITRSDLHQMGLKIKRDEAVEAIIWQIAKQLNTTIGGGVRKHSKDPRNDAMLASSSSAYVRQRYPDIISPIWKEIEL